MSSADAIVVGGGLIGLCSAHFLRRAGRRVRLIERREDVGLETSFGNAGLLTPSMAEPWNAPGVHRTLLASLGRADSPMQLRLGALHHYLGWGLRFLGHSSETRHRIATEANFALAELSLRRLRELRAQQSLNYAASSRGTMKVYRNAAAFANARRVAEERRAMGQVSEVLDAKGVVAMEPLLVESEATIAGGIRYPTDETGNAHLFCQELKRHLLGQGVEFEFGVTVRRLLLRHGEATGVATNRGERKAAVILVAAGPWSPRLLSPLGVRLAIRPVKGYSVSIRVRDPSLLPGIAIIDDDLHAAATPLGATLRLAGTAEFCGWNPALDAGRVQALWDFLAAINPKLAAAAKLMPSQAWCGFRPMSADGVPYIGATGVRGLFVNAGHGHLGWTQAVGSGALVVQAMTGSNSDIDAGPFSPARD